MFSLPSFNPWSLLPIVIGVPAVFAAGAIWDGDRREDNVRARVTVRFNESMWITTYACVIDKAQAWNEVMNARTINANQSAQFDRIVEGSDEERKKFRIDLAAGRAEQIRLRETAKQRMEALDAARSELAQQWRDGRFGPDITCGVLNTPGCPGIPKAAAAAANNNRVPVPGRPAGAGPGSGGAAVPGVPADRPRDAGSNQ